jgi:hypothetical protein
MHKSVQVDVQRTQRHQVQSLKNSLDNFRSPIVDSLKNKSIPIWVHEKLTVYAAKLFEVQWQLVSKYKVVQTTATSFTVTYSYDDEDENDSNTLLYIVNSYLQCNCSFHISYVLPCQHLLAVLRHLRHSVDETYVHLRWHKTWMNGFFLGMYHHHFNDGFFGIHTPSSLSSPSTSSPSPSSLSSSSYPSAPSSPPLQVSIPPFQAYFTFDKAMGDMKKNFSDLVTHNNGATVWVMDKLKPMESQFQHDLTLKYPNGIPTDQPISHK